MRQVENYSFPAISAADWFVCFPTKDFRNLVITLIWTWTAVFTVKVYSSNSVDKPDLSAAAALWNEYVQTQIINLDTHTLINWATWVAFAANWISRYELNENLNSWVWVKITAYTSWSLTVKAQLSTND